MTRKEADLHFLLHSAALIEDAVRRALVPLGLGPSQARVLDALDRLGQASQAELAQVCNITAASMSTMTMRLLAAGFIERQQDPKERRSNILRLSDRGRLLLNDIHAAWASVDRLIETSVGADKAKSIAQLTRTLRDALGGRTPGARASNGSAATRDTESA
ncbi:MarR family winged helix-turn-helix transcriptional regulator [Thalassococcus sp. S3]|uniref:MarR family winged helix-turn-helix transcriptional regulator n=1 Tax=Thalassococcus sp. S3 TaxID=2017482 RepID=UPI0010242ADF|nr:MarR family transcriptional regulator [Thalassococcus sp. S3]QBF33289.1 hypothetical protein CFI11_18975 [Thalassococcus sp. S3]